MKNKIEKLEKQVDTQYNGIQKAISACKSIIITMGILLFISILGNVFLGYIVVSAGITVEPYTTTETIHNEDVNNVYHKNEIDTIHNYGDTN